MTLKSRLERVEEALAQRAARAKVSTTVPLWAYVPAMLADAEAVGMLLMDDGASELKDWPPEVKDRLEVNIARIIRELPPLKWPADDAEFDAWLAAADPDVTPYNAI